VWLQGECRGDRDPEAHRTLIDRHHGDGGGDRLAPDTHVEGHVTMSASSPARGPGVDEVTDAVLTATRALVAIASRSLVDAGTVTVAQYRALVVLQSRGPQSAQQLAAELGVAASTVTRMGDRLVAKRLIEREAVAENRREVRLMITSAGAEIVGAVSRRRRRELRKIVSAMPQRDRTALVRALESFNRATDEVPEDDWFLGWI
jgi:DNA-binding MarR family transcriptional regulator